MNTGDTIAGRYRLSQTIGEGGLGVVWEAWQLGIERRVAIKFLKAGQGPDRQRFDVEAKALGRLNHPNCVTVHDFGHMESGESFLVMEHLQGRPLSEMRGVHLPVGDIIAITKQIVTALAYAHHQGVVHRDLKPENVFLVDAFGGDELVKVLDFGLAKLIGRSPSDITKTGDVFGTPAYMSPEQLRGTRDAGRASDLYSVGVMLYELIDRRLPFWAETPLELGMAHIMKPPPPLRRQAVPAALVEIVDRLLMKDTAARYPGALDLYDALDAVQVPDADSTLRLVMVQSPHDTLDLPPGELMTSPESVTSVDARFPSSLEELLPDPYLPDPTTKPAPPRTTAAAARKPVLIGALAGVAALSLAALAILGGDSEPTEVAPAGAAVAPAPRLAEGPDAEAEGIAESTTSAVPDAGDLPKELEPTANKKPTRKTPKRKKRKRKRPKPKPVTSESPTPKPVEPFTIRGLRDEPGKSR